MYSDFYGFTGGPFQQNPDPAGYFESLSHRRAWSSLNHGLAQGEGFVVLTGDRGTGKTTLVAQLMATIDPGQMTAAHMVGAQMVGAQMVGVQGADVQLTGGQTIPAVARAFGLAADPVPGLAAETRSPFMLDANLGFLRDEVRAGRRCLLVVDEAQALPIAALATLRLMSLFQLDDRPLLQILLVGDTELRSRLQSHPELEPLRQRVVASHHLDPLEPDEVEFYIHHRLNCVGWAGNPSFAAQIHADLFAVSGGVPRRIDQLVDRLLVLGATQQKAHIDATMLAQVVAESADSAPGGDEQFAHAGPRLKTRLEAALARCESQIAELQQAMVELGDTSDGHAQAAHQRQARDYRQAGHHLQDSAVLQERLSSLESRVIEQERTIRHTLSMLIEWIERDEAHGVAA